MTIDGNIKLTESMPSTYNGKLHKFKLSEPSDPNDYLQLKMK
jgi:hypothetical protein